jgi:hypothetical protein
MKHVRYDLLFETAVKNGHTKPKVSAICIFILWLIITVISHVAFKLSIYVFFTFFTLFSSPDYVLKVNEDNVSHSTFACQKERIVFFSFCHVRLNSCQYCMARPWLCIEKISLDVEIVCERIE